MKVYRKIALILAILTGIFIFYISSFPSFNIPAKSMNIIPLIYHFGVFFLLSFSVCLAIGNSPIFVFVFSSVYAGLDELHQYLVPNRVCSLSDFGVDCSGIIFGVCFALFLILVLKD